MPPRRGFEITLNLQDLKKRLEQVTGEEFSWTDIALDAHLHHRTVINLANNETKRVDLGTLERLLEYFTFKGLNLTIADFFIVESAEPSERRHRQRRTDKPTTSNE